MTKLIGAIAPGGGPAVELSDVLAALTTAEKAALRTELDSVYAPLTAPKFVGTTTDRAHFDYTTSSPNLAGFTSRHVDGSGNPATGGILMKPAGDTSEGVIDWSTDAGTGYLIHFTATTTAANCGAIGLGTQQYTLPTYTCLVVSQKGGSIGIGVNNTATSAATAFGIQGSQLGLGTLVNLAQGGAGTLATLSADMTTTGLTSVPTTGSYPTIGTKLVLGVGTANAEVVTTTGASTGTAVAVTATVATHTSGDTISSGNNNGKLLVMQMHSASTVNPVEFQDTLGRVGIYIDKGVQQHWIAQGTNKHEWTMQLGSGPWLTGYVDAGAGDGTAWASQLRALGGGGMSVYANATATAKGSETLTDLIDFTPAQATFYTRQRTLDNAGGTPTLNEVRVSPTTVSIYKTTGSSTFWQYDFGTGTAGLLSFIARPANATKDAGTALTCLAIGATAGGAAKLGLYATTPVVQPTRVGQLTDSSGGASGGTTIAAVVASAGDATGADLTTTKNAIATLAAKINAIEAKLSAAGGGIGVWA